MLFQLTCFSLSLKKLNRAKAITAVLNHVRGTVSPFLFHSKHHWENSNYKMLRIESETMNRSQYSQIKQLAQVPAIRHLFDAPCRVPTMRRWLSKLLLNSLTAIASSCRLQDMKLEYKPFEAFSVLPQDWRENSNLTTTSKLIYLIRVWKQCVIVSMFFYIFITIQKNTTILQFKKWPLEAQIEAWSH